METDEQYYQKDTEIAALSLERTAQFLAQWTRSIQVSKKVPFTGVFPTHHSQLLRIVKSNLT